MSRVAIVAALEREVRPLVKKWRVVEREVAGRRFRFFVYEEFVVVCGGIGAEAARRAANAAIALFQPEVVLSAGFAGALDPALRVGTVLRPRRVVSAADGSSVNIEQGQGILVTFASVASPEQKANLRDSFAAQAVDMEAVAVARAAEARGVRFEAVKVISDEFDFAFPSMERFVDSDGRFREARFAGHAALRPWLWPKVLKLERNSRRASSSLCDWLSEMIRATSASPSVPSKEAVNRR